MAATKTTTQRGLGWQHQRQRRTLIRQHREGTPCWWCGEPMFSEQILHADHTITRAAGGKIADRLLHKRCNEQRGDGSKDHQRPALLRAKGGHLGNAMAW